MFWEVWRNVALATTNWGLGGSNSNKKGRGSSKNSRKLRYDQLQASTSSISSEGCGGGGGSGPKKSVSQPVNLTRFTTEDIQIDHESAVPCYNYENEQKEGSATSASAVSQFAPSDQSPFSKDNHEEGLSKKTGIVKRSISSFFPFTSCTTFASSAAKAHQASQKNGGCENKTETNPLVDTSRDQLNANQYGGVEGGGLGADDIINYWDDEGMELPSCDVCARTFPTIRQLAAHQRKKRHYGCIQCDSIFPSREVLECHREQMCHYEFAIDMFSVDERELDDEIDFFESEDETSSRRRGRGQEDECEDWEDEEMERLL